MESITIRVFTPGLKEAKRLADAGKALAEAAQGKVDEAVVLEFSDALLAALALAEPVTAHETPRAKASETGLVQRFLACGRADQAAARRAVLSLEAELRAAGVTS